MFQRSQLISQDKGEGIPTNVKLLFKILGNTLKVCLASVSFKIKAVVEEKPLTIYTLTSVCIFPILPFIHFLRC